MGHPGDASVGFELVDPLDEGRIFRGRRRVRLGDVDAEGRLRLDALIRLTQEISNDDTTDAGLPDDLAFVVRRTAIERAVDAVTGEELTIDTFCGRLGRRWAERRLSVRGDRGAEYEIATLWVFVDPTSGRPRELSERFVEIYGTAAGGRTVGARLTHPAPGSAEAASGGARADGAADRTITWPLRAVDIDPFGHVNNVVYWSVVHEVAAADPWPTPDRLEIEYRGGIQPDDDVTVRWRDLGDERLIWLLVEDQPVASVSVASA